MSSCTTNRRYINDYSERIALVRMNFPEIYRLYCNGSLIIDKVYIDDKTNKVHVSYRYR